MKADADFPRLTPVNHRPTSPASVAYNCVAWAAGDTENWWQPGVYWPAETPPEEYGIAALEAAFKALGFESCDDQGPEPGFEKGRSMATPLITPTRPGNCPEGSRQASS